MPPLVSLPAHIRSACDKLAPFPYPVLLVGEPGTGKTFVSQQLHARSGRTGDFVRVSLPELPESLEQAELFGHTDAAFTGARRARSGHVEAAHRGTLLLDEIGLARPSLQQALLRLLDEGVITRLGESRPTRLDVRIVGATNEDLDAGVRTGRFRSDLRARFGRLVIRMPPLRERRDEIIPIAIASFADEVQRLGWSAPVTISRAAADLLRAAPWTMNIRDLVNVCRFALVELGGPGEVTPHHLPEDIGGQVPDVAAAKAPRQYTADELLAALAAAGGVRARAAQQLGMSPKHFGRLLKQHATVAAAA